MGKSNFNSTGGDMLYSRKRFKHYTSVHPDDEQTFNEAIVTKRDYSDCCEVHVKIVWSADGKKSFVCTKCGKECQRLQK